MVGVNIKEEWDKHKASKNENNYRRFDITKEEKERLYELFPAMRGAVATEIEKGYKEINENVNVAEQNEGKWFSQFLKENICFKDTEAKPKEEKKKKIKDNKRKINRYVDEDDEILVEQIYDRKLGISKLCVYNNKINKIIEVDEWEHKGFKYTPQEGEELEKGAVLLPEKAEEYDEDKLDDEIRNFVKKWLDVPEEMINFGVWNTKRSYVFDKFKNLNYLRALGDTGCGKSRYLNTFGHIHNTPLFTNGATTPAPLFRMIDKWKPTLVMDEADLKQSDESQDVIKIINQGFEVNNFIMRCDQTDASKVGFFDPYCPKILASRRTFQDKATESRCITEVMKVTKNENIEVNLNKEFYEKAKEIRNKLLMWRFKNYFKINLNKKYDLGKLEPRVKQIVSGYICLFGSNKKSMEEFKVYIQKYQQDLIYERSQSFEGIIIGIIKDFLDFGREDISASDIIERGNFTTKTGKPMKPVSLNSALKSLGFEKSDVRKVDGKAKRCIPINQINFNNLLERYGYEVTTVTTVTGTSENNINKKILKKEGVLASESSPRNDCNSRNLVTDKKPEFTDEEIKKSGLNIKEVRKIQEDFE